MSTSPNLSSARGGRHSDPGGALVAAGAVILLVSLFLHWYRPGRSAWTVFETWDLVLAALSLCAIAAALGRLGVAPRRRDSWLVAPGLGAFIIVVESLINHPPAAIGDGPMIGIWLALFGSLVMLAGAALALANVSVSIALDDRPRAGSGAPEDPGTPAPAGEPQPAAASTPGAVPTRRRPDSAPITQATRVIERDDSQAPPREP